MRRCWLLSARLQASEPNYQRLVRESEERLRNIQRLRDWRNKWEAYQRYIGDFV